MNEKRECEMHGLLLSQSWPQYEASRVHTGYAFRTQRLHRNPGIERRRFHRRQEPGGTSLEPHPLRKILVTWKHYRSPAKQSKGGPYYTICTFLSPLFRRTRKRKTRNIICSHMLTELEHPQRTKRSLVLILWTKKKNRREKITVSRKLPCFLWYIAMSNENCWWWGRVKN